MKNKKIQENQIPWKCIHIIPIVGDSCALASDMKLTSKLLFPTPESPMTKILKEKSHLLFPCSISSSSSSSSYSYLRFQNKDDRIIKSLWKMRKHGFDFPSSGGGIWRESCVERRCLGLQFCILVVEGNNYYLRRLGTNGRSQEAGFCL